VTETGIKPSTTEKNNMIKKYDDLIKKSAKKFLPGVDWRLLKAQLQAESALNPEATSHVGAMGIAQFMPDTWDQMKDELKLSDNASAYNEFFAIPAAAYYMRKLMQSWSAPRPEADRYCLALASYNAGFGNLLKAQKYASNANDYHKIIKHLHQATGKHSKETITYVDRIFKTFSEYLLKGR